MTFDTGPYDPCPCGSGEKYKFCCAARAKAHRHGKYPIGTVAYYGPDDRTVTKIAAGVLLGENGSPIMEKYHGEGVRDDPEVAQKIRAFFARHGVKNVVVSDGVMGCPHEEGKDYPRHGECPHCPFWRTSDDAIIEVVEEDPQEEDEAYDEGGMGEEYEAAFARGMAIVGEETEVFEDALDAYFNYLLEHLQLPCAVAATEDLQWEERYVIGGASEAEYMELRKTQPSFEDAFTLLGLQRSTGDDWALRPGDIGAVVRRVSDRKQFVLGLSELDAADPASPNYRLIHDYGIWFVNSQ